MISFGLARGGLVFMWTEEQVMIESTQDGGMILQYIHSKVTKTLLITIVPAGE